jgi:hypothetical protein
MPLFVLLIGASPASAAENTEPPTLVGVSIAPSSVNVTSSPQSVTVTAHIADGSSGVRFANVVFFSPKGHQGENVDFVLVSGSDTNGVYEASVPFPQFIEQGAWTAVIRLSDYDGNVAEFDHTQLETEGFPATVNVEDPSEEGEPEEGEPLVRRAVVPALVALPDAEPVPLPFSGADLASTSLVASASGAVRIDVSAPAGESCTGSVTLRTIGDNATLRRLGRHGPAILTLAVGSFTVREGHLTTVELRLTAKGRTLLERTHVLRTRAIIVTRNSAGVTDTSEAILTLRLPKARRRHN